MVSSAETASYDALARTCGTVFHSPAWTALFGERLTRCGICGKNGDLLGGFHLYKTRLLGATAWQNPPFTPQCGPFWVIKAKNPVAILEAKREMLDALAGFLDGRAHALVSVSLDPGIQDALPFVWRKFKVVPGYTYVLDLSRSLEEIKNNMSSVRRNDIAKAQRDGLVARKVTDLAVVQELVHNTFARQHVHTRERLLEAILFRFPNGNNSYSFATYQGETPIACCFIVHDARIAYYLLGGYRAEEKHHGAGALALLEAIAHAKELGLTAFDFEGSMIPVVERPFRGFGGQLTPYFMINKAWLPLEMILKCVRREWF